jgi:hypothetical protein
MGRHSNRESTQRQRAVAKQASKVDANHFFNLLTAPELLTVVEAQLPEHRERWYPPTITLAMFLGQVMSADGSCQQAVNDAIVHRMLSGMKVNSANTGGYCSARGRLPQAMVQAVARHIGASLTSLQPKPWLWRGRHVKLVDGTTVSLPDTPENQAAYPQPSGQAPGLGFPKARIVGIVSLSHGAILDAAIGPCKGKGTGEHGLLRPMLDAFSRDDVLLADSYYCSYFLLAELQARGVDVVSEQHGARHTDFRCGQTLGARDHLMTWHKPEQPDWMSHDEYERHPCTLIVRELKVGKKILVTTLLSPSATPKSALGELFRWRWNVELDLRNIKTTLGMETLSCMTPAMCEKEMWVYLLAYNLIRLLMAQAAHQENLLPRQLSYKHTLQVWLAWSVRQLYFPGADNTTKLFMLIAQIRVGNRPDRVEPRAVKRRPKEYPRLMVPRPQARRAILRRQRRKSAAA